MILNVDVVNKIATFQKRDGCIVCGNSDYQIRFTFDSEWDEYTMKTARFICNGSFIDVSFTGDLCNVPTIYDTTELEVGVYAGNLKTTTSAFIGCYRSILCENVTPNEDSDHFYATEAKEAADRAEAAAGRAEYAADNVVTIKGINKTGPSGLVDTYEVELTNGDKHPFHVTNGRDGDTPIKGVHYNDGDPGADGVGIFTIEKTKTEGLVDTYTILLTDGREFEFTVTNGSSGGGSDDPYKEMTVSLFVKPATAEYADILKDVELTWSVSEAASFIKLTNPYGNTVDLVDSPHTDTNSYTITEKLTWTLTAKRNGGDGEEKTKSVSIPFNYRVYWGLGKVADYTSPDFMKEVDEDYAPDFVTELSKSVLTNSRGRTITISQANEQYVYYAVPKALCEINEPTFQIGEFPASGAFQPKKEVTVTKNGVGIVYYLYRSTNLLINDEAFKIYIS